LLLLTQLAPVSALSNSACQADAAQHLAPSARHSISRHFVMTAWRDRHDPIPAITTSVTGSPGLRRDQAEALPPIAQSQLIEIGGVFLGIAVEHALGVRFIAMDDRVADMDQSIWPTSDYARRSAQQLLCSGPMAIPR
jgi:hypothetical protein